MITSKPPPASARTLFCAAVIGALAFVAIDGAIGLATGQARLPAPRKALLYFVLAGSQGVLVGLLLGAVLAGLQASVGRIRVPIWRGAFVGGSTILLAVTAAGLLEWLNRDLFLGPGVRAKPWRDGAEWGFRLLGGAALLIGVPWVSVKLADQRQRRRLGLLLLAAAAAALAANAWSGYRNQYALLHLQLAVAALGLCTAGVHGLLAGSVLDLGRTRTGGWLVLVAAGLLAAAPLAASRIPEVARGLPRLRQEVSVGAFGLVQFVDRAANWTAGWGRSAEPADSGPVEPPLVTRTPVDHTALAAELDALLPGRRGFNVVWIAVDSVRADRMGFLGSARRPAPNLDRLAEQSCIFERAYSPYPTSNLAYSSILTSLAARTSPAYGLAAQIPLEYPEDQAFPALLGKQGFRTAAVTAFNARDVDDPLGFKALKNGFQVFNPDQQLAAAVAPEVNASAIKTLRALQSPGDRPFFLWVHYLDAHDPYVRHPEYDFGSESLDAYDSEVAYVDHHVGKFLETLDPKPRERTILVVFGDHGEEFNDHGGRYHNGTVYEEQIRVPFLLLVPGLRPQRIKAAVSLLDIVPTLNQILDVPDSARRLGRSLVPLLLGHEDPATGEAYSEVFLLAGSERVRDDRAVIVGNRKVILRPQRRQYQFFDLLRDPEERAPAFVPGGEDDASLVALLRDYDARIDAWFGAPAERGALDGEVARLLQEVRASDAEQALKAAKDLDGLLFSGYGEISPRADRELGTERLTAVFASLNAAYPSLPGPAREPVIRMLSRLGDPSFGPLFREEIKVPSSRMLAAASGLARLGDPIALDALRWLEASEDHTDKSEIAWAMARLGEYSLLDWFHANINTQKYGCYVRDSIWALGNVDRQLLDKAGLPPVSRLLRNRVFEESYRHPEINRAIIDAVAPDRDEGSTLILLRMSRNEDPDVRAKAMQVLRQRLSDQEIARNQGAMDEELDGAAALLNILPELAIERFGRALAKTSFFFTSCRVRLARAWRVLKKPDKAREILAEIAEKAPLEYDRYLARRRLEQLQWPLVADPANFRCAAECLSFPSKVRPGALYGARFRLRNEGSEAWWGGWFVGSHELRLTILDSAGKPREGARDEEFVNHLPEEGVNPGEEITVLVLGVGFPRGEAGIPALYFRSDRSGVPGDGVVWRGEQPLRFE